MSGTEQLRFTGDAGEAGSAQAIIEGLFVVMRTAGFHGLEHPLTHQAAGSVAQMVAGAGPPFSLQFIGQAVFRDRRLVPFDAAGFVRAQQLSHALSNLGVHELTFAAGPSGPAVLELASAMSRGLAGPCDVLGTTRIEGISWREVPGARFGTDAEQVDPEVYAAAQLALAVAEAETLASGLDEKWPWGTGMSVVRRVARSLELSVPATLRVMEIAPGAWGVARRAVAACLHVLSVLYGVKGTVATRHAGAHAALALGCVGLRDREGEELEVAAQAALGKLMDVSRQSKRGVEPHRLRVCSLLYLAAHNQDTGLGVLPVVAMAYELERGRRPAGVEFDLSFADLLAQAVAEQGRCFDARYVRVLVHRSGQVPPGAAVRLPDGRLGMVLEPGEPGKPLQPKVLVGDRVVVPEGPVQLVTSALPGK